MAKKRKSIEKRLDSIDLRLQKLMKEEKRVEKEEDKIERKIDKLEKEEEKVEKVVLSLGKVNVKKRQLMELIRASAGAFLGVGIGRGLIGLDSIAKNLAWVNVIGILIFILGISALLIYKDEKDRIKKSGKMIIVQRLFFIYAISLIIEFLSLILFNVQYDSTITLVKIMIVGSYTAMASAITFSLGK